VLLANAHDRAPIIGEIKISSRHPASKATDQNPFYALVQLLVGAAELATESQLARLRRHMRIEFPLAESSRIDLYVLAVFETQATYYGELVECVDRVAPALLAAPSLARRIRRIALLRIDEVGRAMRIRSDLRHDAAPG
jgi:hypothetical protein